MKKPLILILALIVLGIGLFVVLGGRNDSETFSYVGTHYPPYPNGTGFISSDGGYGDKFFDTHSVVQVYTPYGFEIWLSRIESRDSRGIPKLVVTDTLQTPDPNEPPYTPFVGSVGLCGKLGSDSKIIYDPLIVALVNRQIYEDPQTREREYRDEAVRAWKINPVTEKFEEHSVEGIFCNTTDAPPGYNG